MPGGTAPLCGGAGPGRAGSSSPPLPSAPLPPPRTRAAVPRATPPVPPRALLPGRPAPLGPAAPFLNGSRPGAAGCRGSPARAAGKVTETVTVTQRPRNGCGLRAPRSAFSHGLCLHGHSRVGAAAFACRGRVGHAG